MINEGNGAKEKKNQIQEENLKIRNIKKKEKEDKQYTQYIDKRQ